MTLMGEIGGTILLFQEVAPGKFTCNLPVKSGRHYISLHVISDSGMVCSQVYSAALIDFYSLTFQIVEPDKCFDNIEKYEAKTLQTDKGFDEVFKDKYVYIALEGTYGFEVII